MRFMFVLVLQFFFLLVNGQSQDSINILFSKDLKSFEVLSEFKSVLDDVDIVALGENTHGLGDVFSAKVQLVKFLYEELNFDLILFESGFGDAALIDNHKEYLSADQYTSSFSSNYYYNSEELRQLMEYNQRLEYPLTILGFDCQPQQNYFKTKLYETISNIDTNLTKVIVEKFGGFNQLYQYEYNKDTIGFNATIKSFVDALNVSEDVISSYDLSELKISLKEKELILKTIDIFRSTYRNLSIGELMGWPISADIRDEAMYNTFEWIKSKYPDKKIIIWAQNSHIENRTKPGYQVKWMGHYIKEKYKKSYYSLGVSVYSGSDLRYQGIVDFEHNDSNYIAYHLNTYNKKAFVLDLRNNKEEDFTNELLMGMENGGSTAEFIAKDRFDGILFLRNSDVPELLK